MHKRTAHRSWSLIGLAGLVLVLAGCGGSGGSGDSNAANGGSNGALSNGGCAGGDCGTLLVGVTDAEGDFVSYSVDVQSMTLKRPNGASVETLPATAGIDSRNSPSSPISDRHDRRAGNFDRGRSASTTPTPRCSSRRTARSFRPSPSTRTAALGIVDLQVGLSNRDQLVVTRGRAAFLALDFDLAASNEVDHAQNPLVVKPARTSSPRSSRSTKRTAGARQRSWPSTQREHVHGRRASMARRDGASARSPSTRPCRRASR